MSYDIPPHLSGSLTAGGASTADDGGGDSSLGFCLVWMVLTPSSGEESSSSEDGTSPSDLEPSERRLRRRRLRFVTFCQFSADSVWFSSADVEACADLLGAVVLGTVDFVGTEVTEFLGCARLPCGTWVTRAAPGRRGAGLEFARTLSANVDMGTPSGWSLVTWAELPHRPQAVQSRAICPRQRQLWHLGFIPNTVRRVVNTSLCVRIFRKSGISSISPSGTIVTIRFPEKYLPTRPCTFSLKICRTSPYWERASAISALSPASGNQDTLIRNSRRTKALTGQWTVALGVVIRSWGKELAKCSVMP